jgi:signal transduction histidine kinase
MRVDFRRLLDGLTRANDLANTGAAGLPAIRELVVATEQATEALGATFVEYRAEVGRVIAASGGMEWALGQPVPDAGIDPTRPWHGPVDTLPPAVAEPLRSRGIGAVAAHGAITGGRLVGSLQLYFAGSVGETAPDMLAALSVAAHAAAHLGGAGPSPAVSFARAIAEDRDLFLAVTGHELRTPVTVIKGYANTLVDRWDALTETERRQAAAVISQRAGELARLVDRLLTASIGGQAVGLTLRSVPFDLRETLVRAVSELPTGLRQAIRVEFQGRLPLAYGDPGSLASILGELVTNAVRHTRPDPLEHPAPGTDPDQSIVEVLVGADARTVCVEVRDRGTGIDPADSEQAFERFWQGGRGNGRNVGAGLGLHLVRRLVERQGGWVSLRPREGGGTVAQVRLARADHPNRATEDAPPAAEHPHPVAVDALPGTGEHLPAAEDADQAAQPGAG